MSWLASLHKLFLKKLLGSGMWRYLGGRNFVSWSFAYVSKIWKSERVVAPLEQSKFHSSPLPLHNIGQDPYSLLSCHASQWFRLYISICIQCFSLLDLAKAHFKQVCWFCCSFHLLTIRLSLDFLLIPLRFLTNLLSCWSHLSKVCLLAERNIEQICFI